MGKGARRSEEERIRLDAVVAALEGLGLTPFYSYGSHGQGRIVFTIDMAERLIKMLKEKGNG